MYCMTQFTDDVNAKTSVITLFIDKVISEANRNTQVLCFSSTSNPVTYKSINDRESLAGSVGCTGREKHKVSFWG